MNPSGLGDETPGELGRERVSTLDDVALLVDWENIKIALGAAKITPNVTALYEASREYGRVVVARAYMDWQEPAMKDDPPALYRAGLEPVYVPKHRYSKEGVALFGNVVKNSVDVRMAVDATTLCHTNPNIKTFVLVSGDQDFLHVVNALRPYGRKLILIGVTGTLSQHLAEFVDKVIYFDRELAGPALAKQPATEGTTPTEDEIYKAIQDVLNKSGTPGVALLSYIGLELKKRYPTYHPRLHGFTTFKGLIQAAKEKGYIAGLETRGLEDWAYLKGAEKALKAILKTPETA